MPLLAGARLGPYEILAPLGAGGMGEVYKARDTRLQRTVAVKVLPSELSASPEARQRLDREAKTISKLSHPHICALYDVGHHDGTDYLVMELLEGETLAKRLTKGPLPLELMLRCGVEIADALNAAHRQGIVHRDLKPGNVMLTGLGVKLLDFGLASVRSLPRAQTARFAAPVRRLDPGGALLSVPIHGAEQLEADRRTRAATFFRVRGGALRDGNGEKGVHGGSRASLAAAS
jgi:serine/threonine protein kinase